MERSRMIRDIEFIQAYTGMVAGSCQHSYPGGMAWVEITQLLGGVYAHCGPTIHDLIEKATDEQLTAAHAYMAKYYMGPAKSYLRSVRAKIRSLEEFEDKWEDY